MMGGIQSWLMRLSGLAILCSLAQELCPPGGVKRVEALTCALVLLLSLLTPLEGQDLTESLEAFAYDMADSQAQAQALREEAEEQMREVIERELGAYSTEEAARRGFSCRVEVSCRKREGVFLPQGAEIFGESSPELEAALAELLGLPPEAVSRREGAS